LAILAILHQKELMRVKQIIHYAASRIWQELQLLEDVNILDI
jgi:hypothetical protein